MSRPDEDGWTPLCWAVRALQLARVEDMRSERPDHAAVVRLLIENGADPEMECKLGDGETTESLDLLALARRSGPAAEAVISVLEEHLRGPRYEGGAVRQYTVYGTSTSCDICLAVHLPPSSAFLCVLAC